MKTIKDLADLIENNPNCEIVIDNDCWWINNEEDGPEGDNQIARSDEYEDGHWYSGGNLYGAGVAAALVELLNRKGFNIKAGAC